MQWSLLPLQLLETLLPLSDLEAHVSVAVDLITSSHKNIWRDLLHFAATTFYYKLKTTDGYVPATKYHGNVTLLCAKTSRQNLGADYTLSKVKLWKWWFDKMIPLLAFFLVLSTASHTQQMEFAQLLSCDLSLELLGTVDIIDWEQVKDLDQRSVDNRANSIQCEDHNVWMKANKGDLELRSF